MDDDLAVLERVPPVEEPHPVDAAADAYCAAIKAERRANEALSRALKAAEDAKTFATLCNQDVVKASQLVQETSEDLDKAREASAARSAAGD